MPMVEIPALAPPPLHSSSTPPPTLTTRQIHTSIYASNSPSLRPLQVFPPSPPPEPATPTGSVDEQRPLLSRLSSPSPSPSLSPQNMMDVGLPGPIDVRGGLLRRSLITENTPVPTRNAVLARLGTLVGIFLTWLFLLYQIGHNLPAYEEEIHLPTSFDDLKSQSVVLQAYSSAHFYPVLTLFTLVFVFKQTFSIPGSALMNILGGLLYGFWAFPWVSLLTAIGSTLCYRMSQIVIGEFIVARFARSNLGYLRRRVEINRESGNLFYYLLFLRLFPFSPNWFLNVASPFVGVPVAPFFLSIFIGLMPYNYVCVQAAATLAQLDSFADILSVGVLLKLLSISTIALIPALYGQKIANWIRGRTSDQSTKGNQQA